MPLDNLVIDEMVKKIDGIFSDVDTYEKMCGIKREQAEREVRMCSDLKTRAALGDKRARDYLVHRYAILLKKAYDLDDRTIESYISFEEPEKNSDRIVFEMLLELYDFSELLERYDLPMRISGADIREVLEREKPAIRDYYNTSRKIRLLALIIYAAEYGQDVIDTLQHHNINEIGVIDKDYIYIVHKGRKYHLEFLRFSDAGVIENIQKKTTQNSPANYDRQNPTVVSSKFNSSRITVAGYDMTPEEGDLYYNERIFNLKRITLEEMRDSYGTIDDLIYDLLVLNQEGRGSHFITGADMGVGKSTFLLAMMEKVPDRWGIGILDTQNELQARKKYPHKNILTLIVNPRRTIDQCFEFMLKTARDVLYVGEITMPAEVAQLINASLRLNSGVGATMHSISAFEVVANLRNLMMRTDMYNNADTAEADIARGLDLIIHLGKLQSGRIVVENIVEVQWVERDYYVEPDLKGSMADKMSRLLDMAQLALSRYLYRKNYRYNEIIRYDPDEDRWMPVNLPSEAYFAKIGKYVDKSEIEAFREHFNSRKRELKL